MSEAIGYFQNGQIVLRTLSYIMVPLICRGLFAPEVFLTLFPEFPTQRQLDSVGVVVDWPLLVNCITNIIIQIPNFEQSFVVSGPGYLYVQANL
jgi:hypothetical protein